MSDGGTSPDGTAGPAGARADTKAARRAARARVGAYHEAELAKLIGRLREGLEELDRGDIDVFEFDDLVHHYKRAAQKLWSFCVGSGSYALSTASRIDWAEQEGDVIDWWSIGDPHRR